MEALQHTLAVPADKGDNDDVMEDDAHPGPQLFSAKDAQQRLPSAGGLASLVLLLQRRSLVMGGGPVAASAELRAPADVQGRFGHDQTGCGLGAPHMRQVI